MTDNVMPLREPGPLPRLPPINIEAEQHLLGAFLCNNGLLEVVADFLKPEHFANGMHARVLRGEVGFFVPPSLLEAIGTARCSNRCSEPIARRGRDRAPRWAAFLA
jgi:hypothetical protein